MVIKWIQKLRLKKGVLHKELGISLDKKIPMSLLNEIISAKAGQTIRNPTKTGKRRIHVKMFLKKRANLARNLKNIKKKK
jgi:hypothetical protein